MIFYDDEHEELFNKLCKKMPYLDGYHLSLAYLLTMDSVLRHHIGALYDVKKDVIIFEGLNKPFQTSTSLKTTRLAFNLWNGTVYDSDDPETYIDTNGEKNMCRANTMLLTIFLTATIRRTTSSQSKSGSRFPCKKILIKE